MNLREYQAKSLFDRYGIAVPRGAVVHTPEAARDAAEELAAPVVIKPQLGVKGRGKEGGIGFAADPREAAAEADRLLGATLKGEVITTLLVEERLDIADELYVAVGVDFAARRPVLMASQEGGVDIEEVAARSPEKIVKVPVDILAGPGESELARVAAAVGADVAGVVGTLYRVFRDLDAEVVEVNPLIRDRRGGLAAVDAVLNVNHDSVFRHPELVELRQQIPVDDPLAEEAAGKSWTYISLDGDIGILSSGAGLTMAILDLLDRWGGRPANFLDTAQIDEDGIYEAFDLLARGPEVKVLLVNMFAGLNRCDELSLGIRRYLQDHPDMTTPVVVRMIGNMEERGHEILREIGVQPFSRLEEAIQEAVALSRRGGRP